MTNEPAHHAAAVAVLLAAAVLITSTCSSPTEPSPGESAPVGPASAQPQAPQPDTPQPDAAGERSPVSAHPAGTLARPDLDPLTVTLPGGLVEVDLLAVPGGTYLTDLGPKEIAPFWMARTEVSWDAYDVLVYRLDLPEEQREDGVDGASRPTKPYISVDRGFGHAGYPALSMTSQGAEAFCAWLSQASGRRFRLPTALEFEWAARAGSATPYGCGDPAKLPDHAWFRDNSDRKTHPLGEKSPNAWGLHDLHGNAAEWALDEAGEPVVVGGAYRDSAEKVRADARREPSAAWNASDPQVPKSAWWLADANFVGFRIVCDRDPD